MLQLQLYRVAEAFGTAARLPYASRRSCSPGEARTRRARIQRIGRQNSNILYNTSRLHSLASWSRRKLATGLDNNLSEPHRAYGPNPGHCKRPVIHAGS